ncbi:endonuclease/exonuclease/phosphatase family protein [Formosa sediminum]|uniref:endonuclease/exonuclease/phosphatase family protein n=1 Tax=Formosa sediminum TaxID=2594004 RepID=UPI00163DC206|nr:endonuclease/exonuclease/phosphatase family protein [Formosa sediminum]
MKNTLDKIDVFALLIVLILFIGILSSYCNWGWISVGFSIILPVLFILNVILSIYSIYKKKYFYCIGACSFLLVFNWSYSFNSVSQLKPSELDNAISILSFNTKGFSYKYKGEKTTTRLITFLDSLQPDILVLQESNFHITRKLQGYPYNFNDLRLTKGKSLLSIYSKYPIVDKGYIDFPNTRNNTIYADIVIQTDTIRLYNVHLQSHGLNQNLIQFNSNIYHTLFNKVSETFKKQIEQSKQVRKNIASTSRKIIICGDFNSTRYALPYRILKENLNDSYLEEGRGLGTTYNLKSVPLRLDYILTNPSIKILSHQNFDLHLSDHEPVLVNIKL